MTKCKEKNQIVNIVHTLLNWHLGCQWTIEIYIIQQILFSVYLQNLTNVQYFGIISRQIVHENQLSLSMLILVWSVYIHVEGNIVVASFLSIMTLFVKLSYS